jgi:PST family polysaccharide transporter
LARPFGSVTYAPEVVLLSAAVFFRVVSAGQSALVQGTRRIADLARISILGAFFGTVISIPTVYFYGERGIVPSLIAVAAASLATSWWYSRKVPIQAATITVRDLMRESTSLLKLGGAFMASSLLTLGASYAIRVIVSQHHGLAAAGFYQAAWALGGLYVGFILQAMGSDFYPRLTGVAHNHVECNRLVNEQAQISMLLAAPGVLATLAFAPVVVSLFYSTQFEAAVALLRWICIGMALRVVCWPMGFIVLAKGAQGTFLWTEVAATVVHVGSAWMFVRWFSVEGAAAAFFLLYVWHGFVIYAVVRRLSGFRWSTPNIKLGMVFLPLTAGVFASAYVLPPGIATSVGVVAALASGIYALRTLAGLIPPSSVRPFRPTAPPIL